MRVYYYGVERRYQGLYGVFAHGVIEVDTIQEADEYAYEEVSSLIERYSLEEDEDFEQEYNWSIYKIKDEIIAPVRELDKLCNRLGHKIFVRNFCESDPLN